jgi:hypothetical protein
LAEQNANAPPRKNNCFRKQCKQEIPWWSKGNYFTGALAASTVHVDA